VTCPLIRIHPAIVAQAAATSAAMMPGRFFLGVGTGEALNEHVTGAAWPALAVRFEMLEEAIDVMRRLWTGEIVSHRGEHYQVEHARIYSRPDADADLPKVIVAGAGEKSATLAGRVGDGFMSTAPKPELVQAFRDAGGEGKPVYGQATICWDEDEAAARRTAHAIWPNAAIPGQLGQDLPTPQHFEQAAELVTEDAVADTIVCGPDPERHADAVRQFVDAGFDHVFVSQIGPRQADFIRFFSEDVLPKV
jgi:G6PDH family F420-dependent oxidoreductase